MRPLKQARKQPLKQMADNQPFLPFFVGDFLGATVLWEGEERALYMLMLAYQWSGGALPADLEKLSRALAYPHKKFMSLWSTVGSKFTVNGGVLSNERLEQHRNRFLAARSRERTGEWQRLRLQVFQRDNFTCRYCGTLDGPFECDHVFPVSRGGVTALENLATACGPCNRAKSDRTVEEWRVARAN